jgi:hypothetical protein
MSCVASRHSVRCSRARTCAKKPCSWVRARCERAASQRRRPWRALPPCGAAPRSSPRALPASRRVRCNQRERRRCVVASSLCHLAAHSLVRSHSLRVPHTRSSSEFGRTNTAPGTERPTHHPSTGTAAPRRLQLAALVVRAPLPLRCACAARAPGRAPPAAALTVERACVERANRHPPSACSAAAAAACCALLRWCCAAAGTRLLAARATRPDVGLENKSEPVCVSQRGRIVRRVPRTTRNAAAARSVRTRTEEGRRTARVGRTTVDHLGRTQQRVTARDPRRPVVLHQLRRTCAVTTGTRSRTRCVARCVAPGRRRGARRERRMLRCPSCSGRAVAPS